MEALAAPFYDLAQVGRRWWSRRMAREAALAPFFRPADCPCWVRDGLSPSFRVVPGVRSVSDGLQDKFGVG